MTQASTTGLILTGGGARAAYQVGVVAALDQIAREAGAPTSNPFKVIAGTSAGAIIAAGLACHADRYSEGVAKLVDLWSDFRADQVYRADALGVAQSGARWLSMFTLGWAIARWRRARPRSLLDNSPLQELLQRMINFDRLPAIMADGHLHALAVTASSYSSGDHVTFYQSESTIKPWTRSHRLSVRTQITINHLLASSAIPFAFPSVRLPLEGQQEWFGDGAMRQSAPISPAVHMGAEKVLVIGAGRMREPAERRPVSSSYPSLAQIAGHAMSSIFLDSLAVDVERLERINRTLALLDDEARTRTASVLTADCGAIDAAGGRCRRRGKGHARRGLFELSALRIGLHQRADRPRASRCDGASRRGAALLRMAVAAEPVRIQALSGTADACAALSHR